ncbi:Sec-independent protein translocase protein TatB [Mesorhizobium sp.]|uniref:Sec-independent protein translocase protein TatB n=1 Tax=Mesorhizobium sp. TaxID=1871066 RepID=UPI000FE336B6|nr:Sec-independent protein translocase protein TatB [Mesorhizobium sp.]RWN51049.1 MAG: twin-arginine translocase subunit TatB [Mesorhizobium sp.]RWN71857.1 MAG: twin-arginine translocase subunit TatB [Mesorhizobium sp.]RWN72244.1 MAG: twin-arginine translocase subunit TatB [Mesorhizobium sp.]RWN83922.1 MAG: twin-arginine translocase subunit TatB [Mesorhizobium sp.]RWO08867.1 MAG: twin-arginine translocase subunit TatB [Mesorhizobium sp.]
MFDIGWTEMLVIAIVMIVVVGPKDLPKMLRTFGRTTAKMRGMAADFQKQFNDALKEAELDDVKKSVDSLRSLNPAAEIRKQLNPFEQAAADVRSGVDAVMKPKPAADPVAPAASTPQDTELNNGATVLPGVDAPEAAPTFPAMTDGSVTPPVATATPAASPNASAAKTEGAPAKAMPASKAAAKPAAKPAVTKTAAKKAEPKPAPATVKKPAAAAKKTAGAAK